MEGTKYRLKVILLFVFSLSLLGNTKNDIYNQETVNSLH